MDFAFTKEQLDLASAARRYLNDRYPLSRIAELADGGGPDSSRWPELDRLGWLDPDLGLVELALLAEESGRVLHPVPWWSTIGLALPVYRYAAARLPGPATLADGRHTCRARPDGDAWRLDGRVTGVVDAGTAMELVVAARTGAGVALFGVDPNGPGTLASARQGIDPLRPSTDLELAQASARLLAGSPAAEDILTAAGHRARVLLAAEAVGVADRALELAIEYAKTRTQFGRPIGAYQAVAHQLADCYAELELARSLAYRAACVLSGEPRDGLRSGEPRDGLRSGEPPDGLRSGEPPDGLEALACATHATARAAIRVCETAIQVCGAIGVTWEHPLHRWYRRALWLQSFHTGQSDPLATIADRLLGSAR
jgi:alkylation response protein AidB-like acyl-CoA dehydrogenase